MDIQYLIIALILLACVGYVAWRVSYIIRNAGNPCYGCKLHASCMKKTLKQWQPPKKRDHCFAPTAEDLHAKHN